MRPIKTFLVAVDDPSVAQVLAEFLRVEGHDVLVALDGVEALNVVETTTVDGVFLSLVMRGLDGLSVLSRIRSRFPDLPVVILSSHAGPPTRWRLVMSRLLIIVLVIAAYAWIVGRIFRP